ncbi:MAG: class II aldolase/adducin family protein [Halanaerobiaceae bacterium]
MENDVLKNLAHISQTAGSNPALVQGGGGNTSAKIDEKIMAIKASGYGLSEVKTDSGFVKVNYANLLDYYRSVDPQEDRNFADESTQLIMDNIVSQKKIKPSVETGFHSLLKKYVLHTHSVYANIACCTEEGSKLVEEIFSDTEIDPLWIDYTHPGFYLTIEMMNQQNQYQDQYSKKPSVIFMENHGPIVNGDQAPEVLALDEQVNNQIKNYLDIDFDFPETGVKKAGKKLYLSTSDYLIDYFSKQDVAESFFYEYLYPDQIVYLEDNVSFGDKDSRINIDLDKQQIFYRAGKKEALAIEETLAAVVYIREQISRKDLTLKTMSDKHVNLIKNMKAEKHRKEVMKGE